MKEPDPTESTRKLIDVHFCGVATGKGMKHLRKFSKNTQTFLVITLLILLYLMDMLHQPRAKHIKKDMEVSETVKIKMSAQKHTVPNGRRHNNHTGSTSRCQRFSS